MDTDNDEYHRIHFAVMAIESGARKLDNFIRKASTELPMTFARHF